MTGVSAARLSGRWQLLRDAASSHPVWREQLATLSPPSLGRCLVANEAALGRLQVRTWGVKRGLALRPCTRRPGGGGQRLGSPAKQDAALLPLPLSQSKINSAYYSLLTGLRLSSCLAAAAPADGAAARAAGAARGPHLLQAHSHHVIQPL